MTYAEIKRAEDLIKEAAHRALNALKRKHAIFSDWHYSKIKIHIETAFDKSISKQCEIIIKAAEVKPAVHKAIVTENERRKQARKKLADELREARVKLHGLQCKIKHADKVAEKAQIEVRKTWALRLSSAKNRLRLLRDAIETKSVEISSEYTPRFKDANGYPSVPVASYAPSTTGENLPYASGIYFLWNGNRVEYVGRANHLCNRVKLGSHHILKQNHQISFVIIGRQYLTWAECYYIGICRPQLNFGRLACHYEEAA